MDAHLFCFWSLSSSFFLSLLQPPKATETADRMRQGADAAAAAAASASASSSSSSAAASDAKTDQ